MATTSLLNLVILSLTISYLLCQEAVINDYCTYIQALFKDVAPDASGKETDVACRNSFTKCKASHTADLVTEYARNNTMWHRDFGEAFQILIQHGYPLNHLVAAGTELPELIDPQVGPVVSLHSYINFCMSIAYTSTQLGSFNGCYVHTMPAVLY